jgi:predicted kinase
MGNQELILGYPINEFTLSEKLFGGPYLINFKGGLDKWANFIKGGFLEQHFQQFSEVHRVMKDAELSSAFKSKIEKYRAKGLDVTMHAPFLRAHEPAAFLEFDFEWLVVPSCYSQKKKLKQVDCLEARIEDMKSTIDLASQVGVNVLTVHATAPGFFMDYAEFEAYSQKIAILADYIQREKKNVKLAIETGGIMPSQFEKLYDFVKNKTGYEIAFNLDTAHLMLDLMHSKKNELVSLGMTEEDAKKATERMLPKFNDDIISFYYKNSEKIKVVHLTQTGLWADLHQGIEETLGILDCNERLINAIALDFKFNGTNRYVMIESAPSQKGILHFIRSKKGEIMAKGSSGTDESLIMLMGRPASGKSMAYDLLKEAGYISDQCNLVKSDLLREKYADAAFSMTESLPKSQRQVVYDECFRRTESSLKMKHGTVLDATFDQRSNRQRAYDMAKANGVKDLYLLDFHCNDEEAMQRIALRNSILTQSEKSGILPEGRLCMRNPEIYSKFSKEFEELDLYSEMQSTEDMQVHVIQVDTSSDSGRIKLINPDQRSRAIAETLRMSYSSAFNSLYPVTEFERQK